MQTLTCRYDVRCVCGFAVAIDVAAESSDLEDTDLPEARRPNVRVQAVDGQLSGEGGEIDLAVGDDRRVEVDPIV